MALSGVNQSHVQPVWAEIPSLRENISAGERALSWGEQINRIIVSINLYTFRGPFDPSALPPQNLLADPFNSGLPSPDIQEETSNFNLAALVVKAVLSFREATEAAGALRRSAAWTWQP